MLSILPRNTRTHHTHHPRRRRMMPPSEDPPPLWWKNVRAATTLHTTRLITVSRRTLATLSHHTAVTTRHARLHARTLVNHPALSSRLSSEYVRGGLEVLTAAAALSTLAYATYRGLRVYRTAADLPPRFLRNGFLRGTVVSVRDGDSLRMVHRPFLRRFLTRPPPLRSRGISASSISVRLAAVDAPECSVPALSVAPQPFGPRARDWLRQYLLGRDVSVRIHAVDQYRRVVATVTRHSANPVLRTLGLGRRNVSLELTRAGYATLYRGAGAEYGGEWMKQVYVAAEEVARRRGIGMWADKKNYISPAEFKRAARSGVDALRDLEQRAAGAVARGKGAGTARKANPSVPKKGTAITKKKPGGRVKPADEHDSLIQSLYKFVLFSYQFLRRYR